MDPVERRRKLLVAKQARKEAENAALMAKGETVHWVSAWDVREVFVCRERLDEARAKVRRLWPLLVHIGAYTHC